MSEHLPSYPKVWALGHPNIAALLDGPVSIEEKIDGSQFSFGVIDGELRFRSKGVAVQPGAAGMFEQGVRAIAEIAETLTPGWVYRGEYLQKPKHNTLRYARTPARHVMLFDVTTGLETYLPPANRATEAARIGLECVPLLPAEVPTADALRALLTTPSVLGEVPIEGVVIKNYARFGADGKALFGKFVSEAFKEQHEVSWKAANPQRADVIAAILNSVRSERRWEKAVERLRDAGTLTSSPKDIGALMQSVQADVETECAAEIKDALFRWAWPQIKRATAAGLPEWYKQRLLDAQFAAGDEAAEC